MSLFFFHNKLNLNSFPQVDSQIKQNYSSFLHVKFMNKKSHFSELLEKAVCLDNSESQDGSQYLLYSKWISVLVQELINLLTERMVSFEIYTNFPFNNGSLKKQETLQQPNEQSFFNQNLASKLSPSLLTSTPHSSDIRQKEKTIQKLKPDNYYYYLEFSGALFGSLGIEFLA